MKVKCGTITCLILNNKIKIRVGKIEELIINVNYLWVSFN